MQQNTDREKLLLLSQEDAWQKLECSAVLPKWAGVVMNGNM